MSRVSFQSAPRSISPLSEPPTPPPKEQAVSCFLSREPRLPPVASGEAVAQSKTRASILTELCDIVQLSNPGDELGTAAENYSKLRYIPGTTVQRKPCRHVCSSSDGNRTKARTRGFPTA